MTPAVRPPAYNGIPVAAARGTAYGLAAGLLLGLTDTALSARALLSEFDDALTWSPLVLRQLLLPLGPGCLLGCGLALLLRGLDSLSQRQAQGRAGRADRWLGNYLAVLALPGLGLDLDHPQDLARFALSQTCTATHTARWLAVHAADSRPQALPTPAASADTLGGAPAPFTRSPAACPPRAPTAAIS